MYFINKNFFDGGNCFHNTAFERGIDSEHIDSIETQHVCHEP